MPRNGQAAFRHLLRFSNVLETSKAKRGVCASGVCLKSSLQVEIWFLHGRKDEKTNKKKIGCFESRFHGYGQKSVEVKFSTGFFAV